MAHPSLILPQADSACGKLFFSDRHTADTHRIVLEVWNRATGRVREGYRLAVCRCRRCGGYHIVRRPIIAKPLYVDSLPDQGAEVESYQPEEPAMAW